MSEATWTKLPTVAVSETSTRIPVAPEASPIEPLLMPAQEIPFGATPTPRNHMVPINLQITALPFSAPFAVDVAINLEVFFSSGVMEIAIRDSGAGGYRVLLREDNQIGIFRDVVLLKTATVQPLAGVPLQVEMMALGDLFTVSISDTELFSFRDPSPLAAGNLRVTASDTASARARFLHGSADTLSAFAPQSDSLSSLSSTIPREYEVYSAADLMNVIQTANAQCASFASPIVVHLRGDPASYPYDVAAAHPAGEFYGASAYPVIRCNLLIYGNGHTIRRAASTPADARFRIFAIDDAFVQFIHLGLEGAISDRSGGAVFIYDGGLALSHVRVRNNRILANTSFQTIGAGVYAYSNVGDLILNVFASEISGNRNESGSAADGGGIGALGTIVSIYDTVIASNYAGRDGGGLFLGTAISQDNSVIERTFLSNNTAGGQGGGLYNSSVPNCPFTLLTVMVSSCIVGNSDYSVFATGAELRSGGNWWGASSGPSSDVNAPGDSINAISPAFVSFAPPLSSVPSGTTNCVVQHQPPAPSTTGQGFVTNTPIPSQTPFGTLPSTATFTPSFTLTPSPTPTSAIPTIAPTLSAAQLATVFPLPMDPDGPSAPSPVTAEPRLSGDLQWVDRAWAFPTALGTPNPQSTPVCSRDVNPIGAVGNFPLIASSQGEIMVVDPSSGSGSNQNLGTYTVMRLPVSNLPVGLKNKLRAEYANDAPFQALVSQNIGFLMVAYAHMSQPFVSAGSQVSVNSAIYSFDAVGLSGNSGVESEQPHLDVATYYVSGRLRERTDLLSLFPPAIGGSVRFAFRDPNPLTAGFQNYEFFFSVYKSSDQFFGYVKLIDSLVLWPRLAEGVNVTDFSCP